MFLFSLESAIPDLQSTWLGIRGSLNHVNLVIVLLQKFILTTVICLRKAFVFSHKLFTIGKHHAFSLKAATLEKHFAFPRKITKSSTTLFFNLK